MNRCWPWVLMAVAVPVLAAEPAPSLVPVKPVRLYQSDAYGRIRYSQPSLLLQPDGRIRPVDPYGHPQASKPGYQVQGNAVYQADAYGRIQHQKPGYAVQPDGRIIETDHYGHPQYQKPQYLVKDGKIYPTDAYGRIQYDKPALVIKK